MAKAATTENVARSRQEPDARFAVDTIRGSIKAKKDRISGINGEIGDAWGKIENRGVNKIGAKAWAIFDKLTPEERVDAFRTFNAMCDVAAWPEEAEDMVDMAEDKIVHLRRAVEKDKAEHAEGATAPAGTDVSDELKDAEDEAAKSTSEGEATGEADRPEPNEHGHRRYDPDFED